MTVGPVFSGSIKCGHCQNVAPMEVVAQHSQVQEHEDDYSGMRWEEGYVYELLRCPACANVSLRRYFWRDATPEDVTFQLLYPSPSQRRTIGLPPKIERAYEAAGRVRSLDANAYGVLLGRLLDLVCEDRGAQGDTLAARLHSLAQKGEIPEKLVGVAHRLRQFRNVGAHADLGELTAEEVPMLDQLCVAILEYVYTAPHMATMAQQHLDKLKGRQQTERTGRDSD